MRTIDFGEPAKTPAVLPGRTMCRIHAPCPPNLHNLRFGHHFPHPGPFRCSRPIPECSQRRLQHRPKEKYQRIERLGGSAHVPLQRQMLDEAAHLLGAEFADRPLAVKLPEAPGPMRIRFISPQRVMLRPQHRSEAREHAPTAAALRPGLRENQSLGRRALCSQGRLVSGLVLRSPSRAFLPLRKEFPFTCRRDAARGPVHERQH